ncbi:MAG TPA: glycoside hydrolase 100 family protein [Trueperaceae bacterium]|nr:glycoside hydrolase 100 family protein [Trueperaceae bacterium]
MAAPEPGPEAGPAARSGYDQADDIVAEARQRAEALLLTNDSELGLLAATQFYRQLWARDSMLSGLGLLLCDDERAHDSFRRSLATLGRYQSPLGKIPHNVERLATEAVPVEGGHDGAESAGQIVLDTAHAGCVDSNLWFILGHYYHYRSTGDEATLRGAWPNLLAALTWLRYQDSNECGLLEVHEAMDWADLLANRYNVLFDNVLYSASWRAMGELARVLGGREAEAADAWLANALDVRQKIDTLMWVGPEAPTDFARLTRERREWLYPIKRMEVELGERPFYLPYVAFRDFPDRFDTLGNLMAILLGVADGPKTARILDYLEATGLDEPLPVRALYPPIRPGEADWRTYYRLRNLNQPDHYHNGGAWPFVGGIYVAALVKAGRLDKARCQLAKLAEMNSRGRHAQWEFNEWFHGLSGKPLGQAGQSWSAALYVFAHESVKRGTVPVFGESVLWAAGGAET